MKYKLKAKIQIDRDGIVVMGHYIFCSFCGRKEVIRMTSNRLVLPKEWNFALNGEEHTARVMCDKCFYNQKG